MIIKIFRPIQTPLSEAPIKLATSRKNPIC